MLKIYYQILETISVKDKIYRLKKLLLIGTTTKSDIRRYPLSLDKIINKCTSNKSIKLNELETIRSAIPHLMNIFEETGQLQEDDYDKYKIMLNKVQHTVIIKGNQYKRDELTLSRQRSVLLNIEATIERYRRLWWNSTSYNLFFSDKVNSVG